MRWSCRKWTWRWSLANPMTTRYMGINPKIWANPQIIHLFIGFSIMFTIHFGVPLFLETSIWIVSNSCWGRKGTSNKHTVSFALNRSFTFQKKQACWTTVCGRRRGTGCTICGITTIGIIGLGTWIQWIIKGVKRKIQRFLGYSMDTCEMPWT